jgi:hypothetical protein
MKGLLGVTIFVYTNLHFAEITEKKFEMIGTG